MAEESSIPGLIGSSVGEAAAFAAGLAIAPVLAPYLQELRNLTWSGTPTMPLAPEVAAEWVAEDASREHVGASEASQSGLALTPFRTMVETLQTAPGSGELLQLLRRESIKPGDFEHGLRKAKLEPEWFAPLADLQHLRLAPAQIALGVVRSILKDDGLLVKVLDVGPGKVPRYPVSDIDPVREALDNGIDRERLRIMVGEIGLPMAAGMAASALFRNIIERTDYNAAIAEGDIRPEWADAILDVNRQILSANQYAELELRGFLERAVRLDKTDQHGMSHEDSDLLYNLLGRSIPVHQITTGLARGGIYNGDFTAIPAAYLSSLRRGNLRPEYYSLAYANRYSLPSAFVIRALLTDKAIDAHEGETLFLQSGWPPDLAKLVAEHYAAKTAATAQTHTAKAQTQLWTTTHRSYVNGDIDEVTAGDNLTAIGVPQSEHAAILHLWSLEAATPRKRLTPAQVKKAFLKADVNAATGQPWTKDEAIETLQGLGYPVLEAESFLNIA